MNNWINPTNWKFINVESRVNGSTNYACYTIKPVESVDGYRLLGLFSSLSLVSHISFIGIYTASKD